MNEYHVYGLGNALVDFEIEIDVDDLERIRVDKGVMTLVDESRHYELLSELEGQHHSRACGGSAANTAIAMAQLGGKSFYSCRIGDDEVGDFYLQDLHQEGVDSILDNIEREPGVTGKCLVMITPDADRTMNTFLGITTDLTPKCLDIDSLKRSQYVYIEGYLASSEAAVETALMAMNEARTLGISVALSISDLSVINFAREGLDRMLTGGVDLLFCNESEALAYAGVDTVTEAFNYLQQIAKLVVITQGPKGARVFDGEQYHDIAPHRVNAVDTTGAGDLFAGAFLYGLTHGYSPDKAGAIASYASSILVTSFGPRLIPEHQQKVREYATTLA